MDLGPAYKPEFESLKGILLALAEERSVDTLLNLIVTRFAQRPHLALARIWLIAPSDICPTCVMRDECPDQTRCLHLVASAGRPQADVGADWSRLDGKHCRFPLGVRKVGKIAVGVKGLEVIDVEEDSSWMSDPQWARREGIRGFGGQPLKYKDQVLGVLAVFLRMKPLAEGAVWLRMIADYTGAAIANARAFEEIERLRRRLELENAYLREEVLQANAQGDIVGQSSALQNVIQQIELVAPTDASVLILGESGTGKELVAREIHRRSRRGGRTMIKVSCASIPRELYESEFFGHVKGAFTGAVKARAGRFELADGGTLFLDEVGEIPLELQSKLLRVLQEGQYERIGDEKTRQADVRIIAASNRDLKQAMEAGRFRQDLYYRLNVFPIDVAPLRRRKEDIPLLAAHFSEVAARRLHCTLPRMTQANILQLQRYDWPGNVRELQNVIERALITARSGALHFDLPHEEKQETAASSVSPEAGDDANIEVVPDAQMRRRERDNLLAALHKSGWKVYGPGGAAELLGLRPTTVASRIKKMGMKKPQ